MPPLFCLLLRQKRPKNTDKNDQKLLCQQIYSNITKRATYLTITKKQISLCVLPFLDYSELTLLKVSGFKWRGRCGGGKNSLLLRLRVCFRSPYIQRIISLSSAYPQRIIQEQSKCTIVKMRAADTIRLQRTKNHCKKRHSNCRFVYAACYPVGI